MIAQALSTHDYQSLNTLWFALIAVLWIGYFVLEGFDFGVGILLPLVARDDVERRVVFNSIGPFWDGNEVWLIVAGGATFAAFPEWYASMFSAFYLPLLLILVALILRGVAFEFRGKREDERWRRLWDRALFWGSLVPAFLWGVAFSDVLHGIPLDSHHVFQGTVLDLLDPYALVGGLTTLALFTVHGAIFLCLRTRGEVKERAETWGFRLSWAAALVLFAFLAWTFVNAVVSDNRGVVPSAVPVTALAAAWAVPLLVPMRWYGTAFLATTAAIALTTATLFLNLFPRVLVSSIDKRYDLDIFNAASTHQTLVVMSIVALLFTPIVLAYQGWTYWVFRQRIGREDFQPPRWLQRRGLEQGASKGPRLAGPER